MISLVVFFIIVSANSVHSGGIINVLVNLLHSLGKTTLDILKNIFGSLFDTPESGITEENGLMCFNSLSGQKKVCVPVATSETKQTSAISTDDLQVIKLALTRLLDENAKLSDVIDNIRKTSENEKTSESQLNQLALVLTWAILHQDAHLNADETLFCKEIAKVRRNADNLSQNPGTDSEMKVEERVKLVKNLMKPLDDYAEDHCERKEALAAGKDEGTIDLDKHKPEDGSTDPEKPPVNVKEDSRPDVDWCALDDSEEPICRTDPDSSANQLPPECRSCAADIPDEPQCRAQPDDGYKQPPECAACVPAVADPADAECREDTDPGDQLPAECTAI